MNKLMLPTPDVMLPEALMEALDAGIGGMSLFDFVVGAVWNPLPIITTIKWGAQVTLVFQGENNGASLKATVCFERPVGSMNMCGLKFRPEGHRLEISAYPFTYEATTASPNGSLEYVHLGVKNHENSDVYMGVSARRKNRLAQRLCVNEPYKFLTSAGTDWIFAEGPGQVSCALYLMSALVEERWVEGGGSMFTFTQPFPNRIRLGELIREKCTGLYWSD